MGWHLAVPRGETVGLVGESGSGKSSTARAVLGLLPFGALTAGAVRVDGTDVLTAAPGELRHVRRHGAAMIFQDPRSGINPMRTIGDHMTESLRLCAGWSGSRARARALELLAAVRLPRPEEHMGQYPHELSGGMLQRVMIAGALTSDPALLVCDEPTTALDVTTQAEIIALLRELRDERGMGMLFITHDLNLAASLCDRLVVMREGAVEERGDARAGAAGTAIRLRTPAHRRHTDDRGRAERSAVSIDHDGPRRRADAARPHRSPRPTRVGANRPCSR